MLNQDTVDRCEVVQPGAALLPSITLNLLLLPGQQRQVGGLGGGRVGGQSCVQRGDGGEGGGGGGLQEQDQSNKEQPFRYYQCFLCLMLLLMLFQ